MKRIYKDDIVSGLITAEPITDAKHNVLLEAGAQITEAHVSILKTWDIDFIRVREPSDTDETLREQLLQDKQAEKPQPASLPDIKHRLGITEDNIKAILSGDGDKGLYTSEHGDQSGGPVKIGTLLNSASVDGYADILRELDKLFTGDARTRSLFLHNSFNEFVSRVTDFILNTVGVIGYCLYPYKLTVSVITEHTLRTTVIAAKLADLLGYSRKNTNIVTYGALLHDIGCVELPENMRGFKRRFSQDEQKLYQKHVLSGVNLLKRQSYFPKDVLLIIGSHHELLDGSGYPLRLTQDKIPGFVRAVSIANAVDRALYPLNSGKQPMNLPQLLATLPYWSNQYDETMCAALIKYLGDFLMSSRITLDDGRMAEIVWSHQSYREPVIRTSDGEIIDLNKALDLSIKSYYI